MSTGGMTGRVAEASPRFKARIAGVLYLLEGSGPVFLRIILSRLVVSGNAAATATNILANEQLFRLVFASSLISVAFHIAYTLLFYELFKPVNRSFSLLAAFFSLVACAIQAFAALFQLAPLLVLGGGGSLGAFTVEQLQALALLFLNLRAQVFNIYLIFFGFWLILISYLIFRSTFLPRIIGVLLAFDGLGWLTFLSPPLASYLYPYIAAAFGEIPLVLWLLVVGVNVQRWKEQASAAGAATTP
jgi:Domain of unknown function (DUF4386)